MAATNSTNSTPNSMDSTPTLTCAQCGGDNALASRFCQHCGTALAANAAADGASNGAGASAGAAPASPAAQADGAALGGALPPIGVALPPVASAAPNIAAPAAPPVAATPLDASAPVMPEQTANEIDHRRAHQLLDRALMLSERGDLPGAILACRQAVSLAPASAQGYSMWGLLLERAGETGKAIAAYEKVLELAPDSMLERESLQRLRAAAAKNSLTGTFHFDQSELFDDALGAARPAATSAASVAAGSTPVAAITPDANMPPVGDTSAGIPVPPVTTGPAVAAPTALRFDDPLDTPTGRPLWLQALLRQPSYYFRGAPVMATTVISLLFLMWARNWAATRSVPAAPPVVPGVTDVLPSDPDSAAANVNPSTTPMRVFPEGPATITNDPNAAAAPAPAASGATTAGNAPATGGGTTAGGTVRSTNRTTTSGASGTAAAGASQPGPGTQVLRPANPRTAGPAPAAGAPSGGGGGIPNIPAPRVDLNDRSNTPDAPIVIPPSPSDGGGSTAGGGSSAAGGPLRPNSGSGYIRIRPETAPERVVPRSVTPASAPARPDNVADNTERIAMAEARAGRTGRAVERLTSAMATGGSTGYRYQQRATLFLERGDYARAADEYQTAISAYEDQLRRGDDAAQARAGLRSSRSGLRVARAGLQR